eukprot:snap_masked-scaffold_32-processed-gene-0.30-mRNA-1 protein AED:1.00 eAED:1.00 QI:0/0/0/0/1/1/2/0/277
MKQKLQYLISKERSQESHFVLNTQIEAYSSKKNFKMRSILVEWLFEFEETEGEYCVSKETIYTAINFITKFLYFNKKHVGQKLQLIASKIHEVQPLRAQTLADLAEEAYSHEEIIFYEFHLLKFLRWSLNPVLVTDYIVIFEVVLGELFKKEAQVLVDLSEEIARCCVPSMIFKNFFPSEISLSCVCFSAKKYEINEQIILESLRQAGCAFIDERYELCRKSVEEFCNSEGFIFDIEKENNLFGNFREDLFTRKREKGKYEGIVNTGKRVWAGYRER